ncbi:MAG TPA: hypothetical protein VLW45_10730, partial [Pelomicrobium sp.]|nr:hypothetical protein [Pelomicrobium sp.]
MGGPKFVIPAEPAPCSDTGAGIQRTVIPAQAGIQRTVIPANAGIQGFKAWTPASAGVTMSQSLRRTPESSEP